MNPRVSVLLTLGVLAVASTSWGAPPAAPQTRAFTLVAEPIPCAPVFEADGVCLGYNGLIPGPTLDVNLGDTLVITLVNHYTRPVSWHVHGTVLAADMDGIAAHPGTGLVESVAQPGGSFTYTVRAGYAGAWHYHDHVLGHDGSEGARRGLYGGLIVRNGAEQRHEAVYDVHLLDAGANGKHGLNVTTNATSFEVLVAGLGNFIRTVSLRDPTGATIDSARIGPGMSDRLQANATIPGVYKVTFPGFTGNVTVVAP